MKILCDDNTPRFLAPVLAAFERSMKSNHEVFQESDIVPIGFNPVDYLSADSALWAILSGDFEATNNPHTVHALRSGGIHVFILRRPFIDVATPALCCSHVLRAWPDIVRTAMTKVPDVWDVRYRAMSVKKA